MDSNQGEVLETAKPVGGFSWQSKRDENLHLESESGSFSDEGDAVYDPVAALVLEAAHSKNSQGGAH